MTTDDPADWLTLTQAAARTGHTREALRQRVRRGVLRATKGNDGVVRVEASELARLPPVDVAMENDGGDQDIAISVLATTIDDLRTIADDLRESLETARSALDTAQTARLVDHGRAERAEAQVEGALARTSVAEARLATVEAALSEARMPWVIRVIKAIRA